MAQFITMPRHSVYIESSVVSYLTSRPSRDLIVAGNQALTAQWWDTERQHFDLYCSQLVVDEISAGDPSAAGQRIAAIKDVQSVAINEQVRTLAKSLLQRGALPAKATNDAIHIALSSVHGIDFLLTWNCTHIANATLRPIIDETCRALGYRASIICTPPELLGTSP